MPPDTDPLTLTELNAQLRTLRKFARMTFTLVLLSQAAMVCLWLITQFQFLRLLRALDTHHP
jgi:hypothetical protein